MKERNPECAVMDGTTENPMENVPNAKNPPYREKPKRVALGHLRYAKLAERLPVTKVAKSKRGRIPHDLPGLCIFPRFKGCNFSFMVQSSICTCLSKMRKDTMTIREEIHLYLNDANNSKPDPSKDITQEKIDTVRIVLKETLLMLDRHKGEIL